MSERKRDRPYVYIHWCSSVKRSKNKHRPFLGRAFINVQGPQIRQGQIHLCPIALDSIYFQILYRASEDLNMDLYIGSGRDIMIYYHWNPPLCVCKGCKSEQRQIHWFFLSLPCQCLCFVGLNIFSSVLTDTTCTVIPEV